MAARAENVQIPAADGDMPGHLVCPAGDGPWPAVLVVMEAFGLNGHICRVAERLAGEGYVVLAPDLYYRTPGSVVPYDDVGRAVQLMTGLRDDGIVADIAAAVDWLQGRADVRRDRIGMTGFCMGGRVTFLAACHNSAIRAAAPFYGGGIATAMGSGGAASRAPLDDAEGIGCPMLLFFGGDDALIPVEQVESIRRRLDDLGKNAEVKVYDGAPHGFFCEERDSYRPEAAADAWQRLTVFFRQHLQA